MMQTRQGNRDYLCYWLRKAVLMIGLVLGIGLSLAVRTVQAQTPITVTTSPAELQITGTLPDGAFASTLRLTASQTITDIQVQFSDLHDATGDQQVRDPLAATLFTVIPAELPTTLAAGSSSQFTVQVAPPQQSGLYTGVLTVQWQAPAVGQITIPVTVRVRAKPTLVLQDPTEDAELKLVSRWRRQLARTLVFYEASGNASVTNLQLLPQDLLNTEGYAGINAQQIEVAPYRQTIGPGQLLTTTLHFDLGQAAAGEYKGRLFVNADGAALQSIPVVVQVSHCWVWPALVLLGGIAVGLWVTNYGTRGRLRDEYIVRLSRLRDAIDGDTLLAPVQDIHQGFELELRRLLDEATEALRTVDYPIAEERVKAAEELLRKWRANRDAWHEQLVNVRDKVRSRLQAEAQPATDGAPLTVRLLLQQANELIRQLHTKASPQAIFDEALAIEKKLIVYLQLKQRIDNLGKQRTKLQPPPAEDALWRVTEQALSTQLRNLVPDDEPGHAALLQAIALQEEQLKNYEGQTRQLESGTTARSATQLPADAAAIASIDLTIPQIITIVDGVDAGERLRYFTLAGYAIGGLLLAAVGMSTLYLNNPTFGANRLSDYLTLFLYGLGAQTTFSSVTDVMKRFGLSAPTSPG